MKRILCYYCQYTILSSAILSLKVCTFVYDHVLFILWWATTCVLSANIANYFYIPFILFEIHQKDIIFSSILDNIEKLKGKEHECF